MNELVKNVILNKEKASAYHLACLLANSTFLIGHKANSGLKDSKMYSQMLHACTFLLDASNIMIYAQKISLDIVDKYRDEIVKNHEKSIGIKRIK